MKKPKNGVKFGWCTTNQHEMCIVEMAEGKRCSCDCHTDPKG